MKYSNKQELLDTLRSFLRQRMHFYKSDPALNHMATKCWQIEARIDLHAHFTYWRICLEVVNLEWSIIQILPSSTGGHQRIRRQMIDMISHCKQVTSESFQEWQDRMTTPSQPIIKVA